MWCSNNEVVKKTACDELVRKVNAIDTSRLVKKRGYDKKISEIEDKYLVLLA